MLFAKLKKEKIFEYDISPIEKNKVVADYFTVYVSDYRLNSESNKFIVDFFKFNQVPENPASTPIEEQVMKVEKDFVKRFLITLNSDDLSSWGENDESLLSIIATKYQLDIDTYVNL